MRSLILNRWYIAIGILAVLIIGPASLVSAEAPKGITVSPAVLRFTVSTNKPTQSQSVTLTNNGTSEVELRVQLKNVDESSGVLAPTTELTNSQSTAVAVDKPIVSLAPGASAAVLVTVKSGDTLKPGGSYYALVVTQESNAQNSVGLHPSVGAGIFVTNENGANRHLLLKSTSVGRVMFGIPSVISVEFTNDGNVVVVPRGIIVLTSANKESFISKGVINTASQPVFPGKTIVLDTPMQSLVRLVWPRRINVLYQYRFDGMDQTTTIRKESFVIPPIFVAIIILIAIITTFLVWVVPRKKRHKKQVPITSKEVLLKKNQKRVATTGTKIDVKDSTDGDRITVRTD
ncbi:MAG: hypothetical protein U0491_01810 [Candidatus Saccharimonadales bacterium]